MSMNGLRSILLLAAIAMGAAATSQEDDVFDFIPAGGRTLLEGLQAEGLPDDLAAAIASESGDAGFWLAQLDGAASAPAVAALDTWQRDTLAGYLSVRAPLAEGEDLPRDGRDMSLALCQSCHIITVVITQERSREAWLGTMNSPSHIEIETTPEERQLLADYLVVNAGIPIDLIPPELRAGGASY
jgi:hypothetical protein